MRFIRVCMISALLTICTHSPYVVMEMYDSPEEVHHVTFFKVHKTGSSTVQNIFLRFGDTRNLTFVLGSVKHNECGNFSNCISFNNSLSQSNIVPPPKNRTYDILCSHVIYNKEQFQKYLPPDTKYISLVREPVSRLSSAVAHFKLLKNVSFSQYANDPIRYEHPRLNNAMAHEFGYWKELFLSANHRVSTPDELREIDQYTRALFQDFYLIMINERLEESVIILKRMLNWKTQDILFINKMMRKHPSFSEIDRSKLRYYLKLDYALYDMAVSELESKIEQAGPGFQDEVDEFKIVNDAVTKYCKAGDYVNPLIIEASVWHCTLRVTARLCENLLRYEITYINMIRLKQYGTMDTE